MPDILFKWLRPENRRPFYLIIALIVFCCMVILALSLGFFPVDEKVQSGIVRVIGFGGGFLTLLYVIVRGEQFNSYQHKATHDLKEGQQVAVLVAEQAKQIAEAAPEKTASLTVQKINGGLDRAAGKMVDKKLAESPFPTTHGELAEFVKSVQSVNCEDIALAAAREAIRLERGWKPPEKQ